MSVRVPLRFLRGQYGRRALTVLALALGVALVFAIDLVTRSMGSAFDQVIDTMAGRTALEVRAGATGLVPDDVVDLVRRVPGVELAVPVVSGTAFLGDGSGESLAVHGVDLLNEAHLAVYRAEGDDQHAVDDPVRFFADPRAVVLTRTFAARHGLEAGDAIELATPRGRRRLSILSLLDPQGVARVHGGNLVVMDIAAAQELFAAPGLLSRIDLVLAREARLDEVRARIAAVLPSGLDVGTPSQRKLDLQAVMRSFRTLLRVLGVVGLLVAFLIAFNGLSWEFERRAWQLGILSAIGVRSRRIWWIQMQEALLLGVAGCAAGAGLGLLLARLLLPVVTIATALNFNVVAPDAALQPGAASIVLAIALGLGVAALAAWLPAARAVRIGSARTIRGRDLEPEPPATGTRVGIVLLLGGAALGAAYVQSRFALLPAGMLATALVVVLLALVATPMVGMLSALLVPLLARCGGASGRLAGAALRDHPRRVGMSVATIAVGVAVVIWLWILARSFEVSVVDALGRAIRADVVVTSANVAGGFLEAPMAPEVLDEVMQVDGVAAAAGWRALEWPFEGGPIGLSAYDGRYFVDHRFGAWPLKAGDAAAWDAVARGEAVVVSTSFVATTGKSVGDRIILQSPSGPIDLPIVGVTVDFVSPRGTIEMSRVLLAERWRDQTLTRIFALKERSVGGADLRRRIASKIGERFALRILSSADLLEYFTAQVRRAFALIPILAALVFLVILAGLGQSLAASVLERRRELATAHAIGLRATRIRRSVTIEGALVGCMGLALAAVGGLVLAWLWVRSTFQLLLGWALDVHVPGVELLAIGVVTLAVAMLSSWLPARTAERMSTIAVLRSE